MSWFENQIEERREADSRLLEDSLVRISGVIMGEEKARKLGIRIMSEDEFLELIQ